MEADTQDPGPWTAGCNAASRGLAHVSYRQGWVEGGGLPVLVGRWQRQPVAPMIGVAVGAVAAAVALVVAASSSSSSPPAGAS